MAVPEERNSEMLFLSFVSVCRGPFFFESWFLNESMHVQALKASETLH